MIETSRQDPVSARDQFLWFAGWPNASLVPITGDASPRRYFRVQQSTRSAVLMDASLNLESVPPFVQIDEHLRKLGFRAPRILAKDLNRGWLLLEDFGDQTFSLKLDLGFDSTALFSMAIDLLIQLHQESDAVPPGLRAYDPVAMLHDIELFLEWSVPGLEASAVDEYRRSWMEVLPLAHRVPTSLLLRDFHVANLMWLPDAAGLDQIGLLDFQDAYAGPITYDLVSLLEDARRDLPDGLRESMLHRYVAHFPSLDVDAFQASLAILAAQRHTRVLAVFERLSRQAGRHEYRQLHSPRVQKRLFAALQHPMLEPVKHWMKKHAPN